MKWTRAVHHLEELAQVCADMSGRPATIFPLRVTSLWTFGAVLTSRDNLDALPVVLTVDLPVEDVAWLCAPAGAEHWSHATGIAKRPVVAIWRSTRAPLWNHRIRRPLLIWDEPGSSRDEDHTADESEGLTLDGLSALRNGTTEALRQPEPRADVFASRLEAELAVSRRALESATAAYEQRRFSPGKLEPVADGLWRASTGYLDILRVTHHHPQI